MWTTSRCFSAGPLLVCSQAVLVRRATERVVEVAGLVATCNNRRSFKKYIRLGGSKGREFRSAVVEHVAFVMDGPGVKDQALAHFIKRGADDPLLSALDDDENDSKVRSALTSIGALPLPNGVFVSQGPLLEDTMPGIFDKKE